MILLFESLIIFAWFFTFSFERWKGNQLGQFILLYSLPTTFVMEVINDAYFGEFGMIYPQSFFYLSPFKFPIPIVLCGSLYCWSLHTLSIKFSTLLFKGRKTTLCYSLLIIILLNSWYFIELIGQKSGYWIRLGGIQYTKMIIALTYLFYFSFTAPSIIFSFLTHNLLNRKNKIENAPHIVFDDPSS